MFKWICFATAVVFGLVLLLVLLDLKRDVTRSLQVAQETVSQANTTVTAVNANLPEMIAEIKKGTETLSDLAEDVELIKSVAGIQDDESEYGLRSLAVYADEVQKVLAREAADRGAHILIEEIFGSDLKKESTVEEFLVHLNKEMVTLILPLAKSKQEILYRMCYSGPPRRKPYYLQFADEQPMRLEDFIRQHHPESAELPPYQPDST